MMPLPPRHHHHHRRRRRRRGMICVLRNGILIFSGCRRRVSKGSDIRVMQRVLLIIAKRWNIHLERARAKKKKVKKKTRF